MNSEQMLKAVTHICRYFEGFEGEIVLDSIGRLARELLDSDIHVLDDSGTPLKCSVCLPGSTCRLSDPFAAGRVAHRLGDLKSERISVDKAGICPFNEGSCNFDERTHAVFPLFYASERIGTLICTHNGECDELYLSLCKMLALLCSIAVYNEKKAAREKEARRKSAAVQAVSSLSYTERAAARALLASLAKQADEKGVAAELLNASTVAREYGITRSVIASALKKLEGAGVITVRSLGMKGSYIALINPCVTEMLAKEDEIGGGDV